MPKQSNTMFTVFMICSFGMPSAGMNPPAQPQMQPPAFAPPPYQAPAPKYEPPAPNYPAPAPPAPSYPAPAPPAPNYPAPAPPAPNYPAPAPPAPSYPAPAPPAPNYPAPAPPAPSYPAPAPPAPNYPAPAPPAPSYSAPAPPAPGYPAPAPPSYHLNYKPPPAYKPLPPNYPPPPTNYQPAPPYNQPPVYQLGVSVYPPAPPAPPANYQPSPTYYRSPYTPQAPPPPPPPPPAPLPYSGNSPYQPPAPVPQYPPASPPPYQPVNYGRPAASSYPPAPSYQPASPPYQPQPHYEYRGLVPLPMLPPPAYPSCSPYAGIPRVCRERSGCFYTYPLYTLVQPTDSCLLEATYRGKPVLGVCCPVDDFTFAMQPYSVDDFYEDLRVKDKRNKREYTDAYHHALEEMAVVQSLEHEITKRGLPAPDLPTLRLRAIQQGSEVSTRRARNAIIMNHASRELYKRSGEAPQAQFVQLYNTSLEVACREVPTCSLSPYRTTDGTCNNLKYPLWGSATSSIYRLCPPDYADGQQDPRKARDGSELPSARLLSINLAPDVNHPNLAISHYAMTLGQFVAHDLTLVPSFSGPDGKSISCCLNKQMVADEYKHPECYPIPIPDNDPYLPTTGCMEFIRALPAQPDNCKINFRREAMNQVTSYFDGSFLYGSDDKSFKKIRKYSKGLLLSLDLNGEEVLQFKNSSTCGSPKEGIHCFEGGDIRLNQEPPLLAQHILYMREHNRIAHTLSIINPRWSDDVLFEEARKIVIAQLQHVVFNEFLPLMLDYDTRRKYGLLLKSDGYSHNYDPRLKANVLAEFQAAAFRMHSLVQNHLALFKDGYYKGHVPLEDHYFNPKMFYTRGNFEMLVQGLVIDGCQHMDRFFAQSMSRNLFKIHGLEGLDIYAINIQRGRDLGVPGYNTLRERCGLRRAYDFKEFIDVMSYENIELLKTHYKHVDDVDLYTAGLMERPKHGVLVGPTFACIIANQFRRVRLADRHWYERYSPAEGIGFSPAQLQEIRKVTMSRIICENTKIKIIQPFALLKISQANPGLDCKSSRIPSINLNAWKK